MKYILDHKGKMYRKFFEDIAAIPHESFKEKALSDYIVKFAQDRGLWCHQDEVWNVIVKKPAYKGYEKHSPVMIQGHIDMVCVKTAESNHNFDTDPLELYVEDGFLKAKGTTLGADCGHGTSYMLGILDDKDLKHPPLECVFTVQEEVGIGGPKYLDYSLLTAKRLIFTDSMEEGRPELSTTSVLGGNFIKNIHFNKYEKQENFLKISAEGMKGGHAAVDINSGRANAIKVISRLLYKIFKKTDIKICDIKGGTLINNIPNKAEVVFSCMNSEPINDIINEMNTDLKLEFRDSDADIYVKLEKVDCCERYLDEETAGKIIEWLQLIPTGTYMSSPTEPDFPWTSRNLGTINIKDDKVIAGYQFRSSMKSHIDMLFDEQKILCAIFNIEWEEKFSYPGYVAEAGSPMYKVYEKVYEEATGKKLIDKHIHAGTDVGTIIKGMGGLDVIGIGPNTYKFHTPDECMELESYDRAYQYIVKVLENL